MSLQNSLELICFPGAPNLPIFAALELGYFKDVGLDVHLETTPSSVYQIENLVKGQFQIAGTAFDNVVAYKEGQGAISFDVSPDLVAFMGATHIELSLIVAPEIQTYDDIKGRSIALDALATGFAFVLYDMIEKAGLSIEDCELAPVGATPKRWESVRSGDHVGTLTIEPFTSIALANGFRVLQTSVDTVPNYQGGVFAASSSWAENNPEIIRGFMKGYLAGLKWTLDSGNYEAAKDILLAKMPAIQPRVANAVMKKLLNPITGLTPNGSLDFQGIDTVLKLRSRYATPSMQLTNHSKYINESFFEEPNKPD
ncbi:MAG: ABC transporter substrate-binding protein [Rhodospirillaceae bacterium]|nr:ABC transporter substrate-binding protein [Rhodospirillaceae bacterium]|tara:strand:+ start:1003 stop:1938 length:936 start_codon:yes stop_codon:yes gene_type:complete